jgi:sigma-B regulation protein RsbU (phosphoserine phosphatase)
LNGNEVTAIAGSKGHPLGVHHNSIYENGQLTLAAGDSVYLYTDGVTEAFNKKGDLFTEERLEAVLRATTGYRPDDLIKGVDKAVRDFADGAPQSDDITALALRRVT